VTGPKILRVRYPQVLAELADFPFGNLIGEKLEDIECAIDHSDNPLRSVSQRAFIRRLHTLFATGVSE